MASLTSGENVEMSENKADKFVSVSRQSRKRKQTEEAMDTNAVDMKRPHLPPLSGDKLLVCHVVFVGWGENAGLIYGFYRPIGVYAGLTCGSIRICIIQTAPCEAIYDLQGGPKNWHHFFLYNTF